VYWEVVEVSSRDRDGFVRVEVLFGSLFDGALEGRTQ
jgi:hypothetical protein